jgi:hypothetical protein
MTLIVEQRLQPAAISHHKQNALLFQELWLIEYYYESLVSFYRRIEWQVLIACAWIETIPLAVDSVKCSDSEVRSVGELGSM